MNIDNKKILGIVPARGGSKGLARKNIVPLNGHPLISYSILAGLESKYIDTVIVTSEDSEILAIAQDYGADIIKRSPELSTDTASIHKVIAHVIENTKQSGKDYEIVVLLQPTSPLRRAKHIDEAFVELNNNDANSLISVYRPDKSPYKCFVRNSSGYLEGLVGKEFPFMNRQDLPEVFMPNGAIYIFRIEDFLKEECIPMDRVIPYIMDAEDSIDIDTRADVDDAAEFLEKNSKGAGYEHP